MPKLLHDVIIKHGMGEVTLATHRASSLKACETCNGGFPDRQKHIRSVSGKLLILCSSCSPTMYNKPE